MHTPINLHASHTLGGVHAHFPLSIAATNGPPGRAPIPDPLSGQLAGGQGCSAMSTCGPQHIRLLCFPPHPPSPLAYRTAVGTRRR